MQSRLKIMFLLLRRHITEIWLFVKMEQSPLLLQVYMEFHDSSPRLNMNVAQSVNAFDAIVIRTNEQKAFRLMNGGQLTFGSVSSSNVSLAKGRGLFELLRLILLCQNCWRDQLEANEEDYKQG